MSLVRRTVQMVVEEDLNPDRKKCLVVKNYDTWCRSLRLVVLVVKRYTRCMLPCQVPSYICMANHNPTSQFNSTTDCIIFAVQFFLIQHLASFLFSFSPFQIFLSLIINTNQLAGQVCFVLPFVWMVALSNLEVLNNPCRCSLLSFI